MPTKLRIAGFCLPLALLSCTTVNQNGGKCVPGASVTCACSGGQQGTQTCTSASTFAACQCSATTTDATVPDTTPVALSSDTGTAGSDLGGKDVGLVPVFDGSAPDIRVQPPTSVTFSGGQAQGLMSGLGSVAMGTPDVVTDPTCGGKAITRDAPCTTATTWNAGPGLCVTGNIPAIFPGEQYEYDNNWGIQIRVNASEPAGSVFDGSAFGSVTFYLSGSVSTELRAVIHRKGDAETATYCASFQQSGRKIPLSAFNAKCWDGSGTSLAAADLKLIDWVGVQVSSGAVAIAVSNLCLTSIVFEGAGTDAGPGTGG